MLNLLYAFKRLLRDRGLIRKLSLLFGASGDQVDAALDASSPVILGRLAEIAEGDDGQERLGALLDASDPEVLSSASDFLERDNTENDKLVTELFGDDRTDVVNGISGISGVSTNTVGALLPKLAPMLLGFLGRHRSDNSADAAEMQRVVLSERDEIARTDRGAALLGLGAAGAAAGGVAFFGSAGEDNPNPADADAAESDVDADADAAESDVDNDVDVDSGKPKTRRIHFDEEPGASNKGVAGAAAVGGAALAGAAASSAGKSKVDKDTSAKDVVSKDSAKDGSAKDSSAKEDVADTDAAAASATATGSKKSYSYGNEKSAAAGSTQTTTRSVGGNGTDENGLGWLWWLLGLLAALIVLGLILAQCGGDSDDEEASSDVEEVVPVVTTSSAPEPTVAPTTVAPTTVAPTTVAPTTAPPTTLAPTTTTTEAPEPEPEPEADLGDPLTAGTLIGGFSLANAFADAGGDFQAGIDAQSSVASSGVEFAPFGPFNIDVGGESITMDWNEAPEFDDAERTIEAGSADQYTFSFDDSVLEGVAATADDSQTLVPEVSQPDDNTIVVEFGEGLTLGDGQTAVITLISVEPVEGPEMESLPVTGVEANQIAGVGAAFILVGFGLVGISRRREQQFVTL